MELESDNKTRLKRLLKAQKDNVCRVCLSIQIPMYPIFNPSGDDIDSKIMRCADVKIQFQDGYPETICSECISKLNVALSFRDTCEATDKYLRGEAFAFAQADARFDTVKKEPESENDFEADLNGISDKEEDEVWLPPKKERKPLKKIRRKVERKHKLSKDKIPKNNVASKKQNGSINIVPETVHNIPEDTPPKKGRRRKKNAIPGELMDSVESKASRVRSKRLHICEVCGRALSHSVSLKSHMLIHQGELPFQCTMCPHRSRLAWSLKIHMRVHAGEKPFTCTLCPRTFLTASNRSRHMMAHQQVKPFQCDMCDKAYAGKSSLDDHKAIVHIGFKRHHCDICGERYPSRKSLRNHRLVKHYIVPKQRSLAVPPPKPPVPKINSR